MSVDLIVLFAVIFALCFGFCLGWASRSVQSPKRDNDVRGMITESKEKTGGLKGLPDTPRPPVPVPPPKNQIPPPQGLFVEGKMSKGGLNDPPVGPRPTTTGPQRPTDPPNRRIWESGHQ